VPEAHPAAEELAGGNEDRGIPEEVVERGRNAPGAQRVKKNAARFTGLVRVAFVKEVRGGMLRVEKRFELGTQDLDLVVVEDPDAGEKSVAVKGGKLLGGERPSGGAPRAGRAYEQRPVRVRQILRLRHHLRGHHDITHRRRWRRNRRGEPGEPGETQLASPPDGAI
jgi:hypothetical protein